MGKGGGKATLSRTKLGKYIIIAASIIHVGWAILLALDPSAGAATPTSIILRVMGGPVRAAIVLTVAAVAAMMVPFLRRDDVKNSALALMLIPQQMLLIMSAGAGIRAAVIGHYADGVARSTAFILADQLTVIVLALLYTMAVIESAVTPPGVERRDGAN